MNIPKIPSLGLILGALRMVDAWLKAQAESIKARFPDRTAEVDAVLARILAADAMLAELVKLADAIAVLKSGRSPVESDDVDLA